jgi:hypothetical protein
LHSFTSDVVVVHAGFQPLRMSIFRGQSGCGSPRNSVPPHNALLIAVANIALTPTTQIVGVNRAFQNHLFVEASDGLILNHRIGNLQTVVEKGFSNAAVRLWSGV